MTRRQFRICYTFFLEGRGRTRRNMIQNLIGGFFLNHWKSRFLKISFFLIAREGDWYTKWGRVNSNMELFSKIAKLTYMGTTRSPVQCKGSMVSARTACPPYLASVGFLEQMCFYRFATQDIFITQANQWFSDQLVSHHTYSIQVHYFEL